MDAPSSSAAIAKALRQPALFGAQLRRGELAALTADWPLAPITVHVARNTAFEFVASAGPAFLSYADLEVQWRYSDYDDSLSFGEPPGNAAVILLWLDFDRYRMADEALAAWIAERATALRAQTPAPILVADRPGADGFNDLLRQTLAGAAGVFLYPRAQVAERLGNRYRDARMAAAAGSDLSNAAALEHARDLGLVWIPALVSPPLKCLALDLDNTLYAGVLGEDGPQGLQLTDAHARLQRRLVDLHGQGLLLALLSKNEPADVEALFDARPDFPLRPEHLSARAIGWGAKSAGLVEIAQTLNIGPDAILLLDDNLGEIAEVATALPSTPCLHTPDPEATLRALDLTPGLMRLSVDTADRLRAADLAARGQRLQHASAAPDPAAYHAALHTRLTYARADAASIERLQALSIKTNQFNLALARLTHAQAQAYLNAPDRGAFGVALSDDLSDSGVIAAIFARRDGEGWIVDDLCISCRALGRGLEDDIVLGALEGLGENVGFAFAEGPRNGPARAWLERLSGAPLPDAPGIVRAATGRERLAAVDRIWIDG
jgi:FkbH-like protein